MGEAGEKGMHTNYKPHIAAWCLAAAAFAVPAQAEPVRIAGTGAALGTMRLLADAFHATGTPIRVSVLPAIGSGGGIKAVLGGGAEIAVISRPATAEEQARGASALEYGRTPFVFATWPGNPIDGVTLAEVAELYAGKRTQWANGKPVRLVLRPMADIDTQLLAGLSPALRDAVASAGKRPGMIVADTDSEAADLIERTEGSFGVTSLGLVLSERRKIKVLKLDGMAPGAKSLADGRYGLQKRLYLVTVPRSGPGAREFAAFVQSRSGRAILERTGHVPTAAR